MSTFITVDQWRNKSCLLVCILLTISSLFSSSTQAQLPIANRQANITLGSVQVPVPNSIQWIWQLDASEISVREAAAQKLASGGPECWDSLIRAARFGNVQVQREAQRILASVEFYADYAETNPQLLGYQRLDFRQKARRIIRLSKSVERENQNALVWIARFELDELLSRAAAVEVITSPELLFNPTLFGTSGRVAIQWLRHTQVLQTDMTRSAAMQYWARQLQDPDFAKAHPILAGRLQRWFIEYTLRQTPSSQQVAELQQAVLKHCVQQIDVTTSLPDWIECFDWLRLNGLLQECQTVSAAAGELVHEDARFLFRQAELARLQHEPDSSVTGWLEQYDQMELMPPFKLQLANHLSVSGLEYWSRVVLERLLTNEQLQPVHEIPTACLLSELQIQQQDYENAAAILKRAKDVWDPGVADEMRWFGVSQDSLQARWNFCLYHQYRLDGESALARTALLDGLQADPENADLLIALSQTDATDTSDPSGWKQVTQDLVQTALQQKRTRIQQLRNQIQPWESKHLRLQEAELAAQLNSYAWLACQSSDEVSEAESAVREALQLVPQNPDYLDTLSRCLFEQNRLTDAITYKKCALRQNPYCHRLRSELMEYQQRRWVAENPTLFR